MPEEVTPNTPQLGLDELGQKSTRNMARADRLLGQWYVGTQWREGQAATHLKIIKMGT